MPRVSKTVANDSSALDTLVRGVGDCGDIGAGAVGVHSPRYAETQLVALAWTHRGNASSGRRALLRRHPASERNDLRVYQPGARRLAGCICSRRAGRVLPSVAASWPLLPRRNIPTFRNSSDSGPPAVP